MVCGFPLGRVTTVLTFGLALLVGCSSGSVTSAEAAAPLPPGAAATSTYGWSSPNPTVPRAVSNPEPFTVKQAYAPRVPAPVPAPLAIRALPPVVPSSPSARDLRIMTFNLRVRTIFDGLNMWDMRRDLVVQRIRNFDPDLLGTQEGLSQQEDFLREQLSDYTFFGVGRSDGKRGGEMCGVFFRGARFDLIDGGHFWLSKTPNKPGSHGWGAIFPRMVTWVKLRPRDGSGPAFCWFNTHFDAWNGHARAESAKMMVQWMDRIAGTMPRVVTGDFNAVPASDPYRTLLAQRKSTPDAALLDAFRVANPRPISSEEGTMHNFSGRRDGDRIDWILTTPQFQVVSAAIDRARGALGYPSDHFPVTATLRPVPALPPQQPVARVE